MRPKLMDILRWINVLLVACLVLSPTLLSGCQPQDRAHTIEKAEHAPVQVTLTEEQARRINLQVGQARMMELTDTVVCNGQIQAANYLQAEVFPPAPGRALEVGPNLGTFVRAGQLLTRIRSDEIGQLQSELLQTTLQNEMELRQAQVQMERSKAAYERELQLFEEDVSPRSDMETARAEYRSDQENLRGINARNAANIRAIQERFSLYGVSPAMATQIIRSGKISPYLNVLAPRGGVIIERNVNSGEMVDMGQALFTIADLSRVWLIGNIYEKDISKMREGQTVHITLDSDPLRHFIGTLQFVGNTLDPETRTLPVRGEISNPGLMLKPNMFARMTIEVGKRQALAVPQTAVQQIGDHSFVFVETSPLTFEERRVRLGLVSEPYIEILEGLQEGETIAMNGTVGLKGMVLKVTGNTGGS